MNTVDAIKSCDAWLRANKSSVNGELIIVGGAALNWSNYTDRTTTDVDTIDVHGGPDTFTLVRTLRSFADSPAGQELQLDREWINTAAAGFVYLMLENWQNDLVLLYDGSNIRLYCPSRLNLIVLKLVASADRGRQDIEDLQSMQPTRQELQKAHEHLVRLATRNTSIDLQKIGAVLALLEQGYDGS